jgi:hypothetical protein
VANREVRVGLDCVAACGWLFIILALSMFPTERGSARLRWVAVGVLVLAVGIVTFGVVRPVAGLANGFADTVYAWLVIWSMSRTCLVCTIVISLAQEPIPGLLSYTSNSARRPHVPLAYYLLSIPALLLASAALVAMVRRGWRRPYERWLLGALGAVVIVLLRNSAWPSPVSPVRITTPLPQALFAGCPAMSLRYVGTTDPSKGCGRGYNEAAFPAQEATDQPHGLKLGYIALA